MAPVARPVYTEFGLMKSVSAVVPRALRQPSMFPLSVAKINRSPLKPVPELKTTPVGFPGTFTIRPCLTPAPLYKVDRLAPLSDTQNGEVGANARPHGFCRDASVVWAMPGTFETRLVWENPVIGPAMAGTVVSTKRMRLRRVILWRF